MNVYLSEELATAVKEAGIPISAVCQRALEDALRASTSLRQRADKPSGGLPADVRLPGPATDRLVTAIGLAYGHAREGGHAEVTTAHLVLGMLEEAGNLGARVVQALDIELADLRTELAAVLDEAKPGRGEPTLDEAARVAIDGTRSEALRLGHNYVGCEHLLLAVVAEPRGPGGRVLRAMGVDLTVARRAVVTALTGFIHARANPPVAPPVREPSLDLVLERLDRIEAALSAR